MATPRDKTAILIFLLLGLGVAFAVASSGGMLGGASYDVDLREKAATVRYKEGDGYGKASGQVKRTYKTRTMDKIKGITVHHVGVPQVGESGIHKFTYHAVVHHDGTVYWLHPFTTYLLHGHNLNRDTIAIAVSGSFGDVTKELPPAQAEGLRRAIAWATATANAEGADVSEIWTHRQASAGRGYDPGRSPYREGVLWAQSSLGLEHDPQATRGTGLEIPDKWLAETVEQQQDPILLALLEDVGRVSPRTGIEAFAWAEHEADHIAGTPDELGLV